MTASAEQAEVTATTNLRLLIVDDDQSILRLLSKQVEAFFGEDAAIRQATDALSALNIVRTEHQDVVITDLDMDEKNGFHLLKEIKQLDPLIQVIIVTGHDSPNAIRSAFTMGADEYFIKPAAPKELVDAISYLTNRIVRWKAAIAEL